MTRSMNHVNRWQWLTVESGSTIFDCHLVVFMLSSRWEELESLIGEATRQKMGGEKSIQEDLFTTKEKQQF